MTALKIPKKVSIPLDEAARLLLATGLLFEINRVVLHPYGLALAVSIDDDKDAVTIAGLVTTDDPIGFTFGTATYDYGSDKFSEWKQLRKGKLEQRERALGYVVQDRPGDPKA